jgi:NAD(P)-dependent dehydrogenase (short-subunit alcohol dehydrogenase family)
MECFDNSHLQGTNPVAAMAVFIDGKPARAEYRRYRIKQAQGNDDYAMMREVLTRRFQRAIDEGTRPDLLVIDGGKGQLGIALAVLQDLGLHDQSVCGIAKPRTERRKGDRKSSDKIVLPHRKEPLKLGSGHPALRILQHLRDHGRDEARAEIDWRGDPQQAARLIDQSGNVRLQSAAFIEQPSDAFVVTPPGLGRFRALGRSAQELGLQTIFQRRDLAADRGRVDTHFQRDRAQASGFHHPHEDLIDRTLFLHILHLANAQSVSTHIILYLPFLSLSPARLASPNRRKTMTNTAPTALITGTSRGLGRSMALSLAAKGWNIIGTYRSRADEADEVTEEIAKAGQRAVMLAFDAEESDPASFIDHVKDALGELGADTLDALVNNAGAAHHAPIAETDLDALDTMYRLHVRAPLALTQVALPLMGEGGRILFVSSGLARFALPGYGAYAAMKGAVEVLSRYAAKELGERKIRINTIAPGAIETDFGGGAVRDNPEVNQFVSSMTALGRPGLAQEIGDAVAAILSDDMRWMSGERVEISGGQGL